MGRLLLTDLEMDLSALVLVQLRALQSVAV
jgi:hypothetical protein